MYVRSQAVLHIMSPNMLKEIDCKKNNYNIFAQKNNSIGQIQRTEKNKIVDSTV